MSSAYFESKLLKKSICVLNNLTNSIIISRLQNSIFLINCSNIMFRKDRGFNTNHGCKLFKNHFRSTGIYFKCLTAKLLSLDLLLLSLVSPFVLCNRSQARVLSTVKMVPIRSGVMFQRFEYRL